MKRVMAGTNQKLLHQRFSLVEFTKPHNGLVSTKKTFSIAFYPGSATTGPNKLLVRKTFLQGRGLCGVFWSDVI